MTGSVWVVLCVILSAFKSGRSPVGPDPFTFSQRLLLFSLSVAVRTMKRYAMIV